MTANKRFTMVNPNDWGFSIRDNVSGKVYNCSSNILMKDLCVVVNTIVEENEQLKQEIRQLQHWNKCLTEKRHQELSYRPYTASKSEKELKDFLEHEIFNCSDR